MTSDQSIITQKTRELCQAILDQPDLKSARERIDRFASDTQARSQYESLMAKGQALQEKQQLALPLTQEEIASFERERDAFLNNPVARGFLDAQEQLQNVHRSINQFVARTLELGRLPTQEDFDDGCGDGCGCGHDHGHQH
ncbi:MAG TPA: YlbF family regulator [Verrucomicrobia bacterium]|nr:YlbF family regulator [Verrucomicrobiota bacterium]HOP97944.1 YlbF family regulator [Verrucomicrobiota bacterium]HPU55018.1 YlbF family regulator [Verrucomicrobiota bacterium]